MIERIYSTLPTFKEVVFHQGLNIIISEKTETSISTQTRNGAGKTTLLELIHFILAGKSKESIFNEAPLSQYKYFMDLSIDGIEYTICRYKNKITIKKYRDNIIDSEITDQYDRLYYNLGDIFFPNLPNCISFRQAIAFFFRRQLKGGFLNVTEYVKESINKLEYKKILAYLLGLNPNYLQEWIHAESKKDTYTKLKKIIKNNNEILGIIKLDKGSVKSEIVILTNKIRSKEKEIKQFNILPTYREYENKANELTNEINKIVHDNFYIKKNITELKKMINEEFKSNVNYSIKKLYKDVNIFLPEKIYERFDELEIFHNSVIENRKLHIENELNQLKDNLDKNDKIIEEKSDIKQKIMIILNSNGALDQYSKLQDDLNEMQSKLKILNNSLEIIEQMENINKETKEILSKLKVNIDMDLIEQKEIIDQAILSIYHSLDILYGENHIEILSIDSDIKNGLNIELSRPDNRSTGIMHMLILCFDLMLMEINRTLNRPLDFMFHDSHIFDGVDSRQCESALKLAIDKTKKYNFQYITTMNSDLYSLFEDDFSSYKVKIKLTDKNDTGGLLGMRI